jgi:acetoin utilization deacetylase AcuC-like enzyme
MRHKQIATFYMPQQVDVRNEENLYTRSPNKPALLLQKLKVEGFMLYFDIKGYVPFEKEEFYLAHTKEYVDAFFAGTKPLATTNGLTWSENLVNSVRYTCASLYHAIKYAVQHPNVLTLSPTSGFHHAKPDRGSGFCTFSGQVIASVKLYREFGLSGAYLDLDHHFGNSIEDSRSFVPDLDKAIPNYANVNLKGTNESYLADMYRNLAILKEKILAGDLHYVVWCHGADSHVYDDLGGSVNTDYWLLAAEMFYKWVLEVEQELGHHLPISMSLFGGYRTNSFDSVLSLHIADLLSGANILLGHTIAYKPQVEVNNNIRFEPNMVAIANGETLMEYLN